MAEVARAETRPAHREQAPEEQAQHFSASAGLS